MFGIFCCANGIFATLFIKETKGRSLEEMDVLFGAVDAATREADVEKVLEQEKQIVRHDEEAHELQSTPKA